MSSGKSVVVIGGGVIGLCTAYYALRAGHRVTVVERGGPGHDGCSLGNAGLIVPSHFVPLAAPGMVGRGLRMMWNPESPFWIRPRPSGELLRWVWQFLRAANAAHLARAAPLLRDLHLASRRCYEELADRFGSGFGLVRRGALMLCHSEHGLREEAQTAEMARQLGLSAETLSPEEAVRLESGIEMDIAGAIYYPQDCHFVPDRFMAGLTQELRVGGAVLRWSTEAQGWRVNKDCVKALRTSDGDLTADEYVLAAGAWSSPLARALGLRLPLQAGKGYSLTLPQPRQRPTLSAILTEARVAVTPMGSGLRFAGTMEITGLDTDIHRRRVNGIIRSIPRYFPAYAPDDFRDVPVWSGLRPCSPDGLPYVGRSGRYRNLLVATGHAMLGMSLGPITGQLMADLLSDRKPSLDIGLLNADRYG